MYTYSAKVIDVYDGDTITAEIDLGFKLILEEKIRLYGINAPEVKGIEKERGIITRDFLRKKILDKQVLIKTLKDKKGKYGRYLATIILNKENINDWLVKEGLAQYKKY